MANPRKSGQEWRDDELDVIVTDYFSMLADDLAGRPYVKAKHRRALMEQVDRTRASVEFKHQNISAVLDELGLPWIAGYIPMRNYQSAIFGAVDRYLTKFPSILELVPASPAASASTGTVFVPPPPHTSETTLVPKLLERLVQKFDPVERDHRNRSLGKAGEEYVVGIERRKLHEADRPDLARSVRWVAKEDGDGAGYDVLSFDVFGREQYLEVKTTNGSARTPFFLTRTECATALERPADWRIYRVHQFAKEPRIFVIAPPLENSVRLSPETWRATF